MEIKKIFVIFKTHLDIGFTDFSQNVVNHYRNSYIPNAIRVAEELEKQNTPYQFVWTTGSWLIANYLENALPEDKKRMETAIRKGFISWHGLPFTTHTELMNLPLFQYGLSLSERLDKAFGKHTISAKMTDVPGHTKASIAPMVKAGIRFLHIGVNPASTPPSVPPLFRWVADTGEELLVMYNTDYGKFTPLGDTGSAVYFAHTGDNLGPQSSQQIIEIFEHLKKENPQAELIASDLNRVAEELEPIRAKLPCITEEIGDSWIHGGGTDPRKISGFRALLRTCETLDKPTRNQVYDSLLLVPEHTWGLDEKTHLNDHDHFIRNKFEEVRTYANFKKMEVSWEEQRNYVQKAADVLGEMGAAVLEGYRRPHYDDTGEFTADVQIHVDAQGAIDHLLYEGIRFADEEHKIGLFLYEQFAKADYDRFYAQYVTSPVDWAKEDFQKLGMETGIQQYKKYVPENTTLSCFKNCVLIRASMPLEAVEQYGCPKEIETSLTFAPHKILIDVAWFEKPANRMAEAIWIQMNPIVTNKSAWKIRKLGQWLNPFAVVKNGGKKLQGTDFGVKNGNLTIETLDAALVAMGKPSLLNFNEETPNMENGVFFNLYNNVWGTNFPMWYGEDARFRFILSF